MEKRVLSLEWKRVRLMDGDSGDEGDDQLACVRPDENDNSL